MKKKLTMVYWKSEKFWLGKLLEYPHIMTQGKTVEELKENIKDAFRLMVPAKSICSESPVHALKNQTRVCAAKTEGVGDCCFDFYLPGPIGHAVKIALRIGCLIIDGGRYDSILNRHAGKGSFQCTCGSEWMSRHRLRGTDRKIVGMVFKYCFNGLCFNLVV